MGWLQHQYAEDSKWTSILKGGVGGLVIGVPLPIAGTVAGGAVLAASGLNQLKTLPWDSTDDPPPTGNDESSSSP